MISFVRLVCEAEGRPGNVVVNRKIKTVFVNTMKIILVQTFTDAEWTQNCNTHADEFIENVKDKWVFVRVELDVFAHGATIGFDAYKKYDSIWYGVHKDDVKKLGL